MTPFSRAALTRTEALAVASSLPTKRRLTKKNARSAPVSSRPISTRSVCSGCQSASRTGSKPCSFSVVTAALRAAFCGGVRPGFAGPLGDRRGRRRWRAASSSGFGITIIAIATPVPSRTAGREHAEDA